MNRPGRTDIKGELVTDHGYKAEVRVAPAPEVLPGERGGEWTIKHSPEQPYCDFANKTLMGPRMGVKKRAPTYQINAAD